MTTNVVVGGRQGNTVNPVEILLTDKNLPADLHSHLNSLMMRIEELQRENERLLSRISRCQCSEYDLHVEKSANCKSHEQAKQTDCQHVTMHEYAKRYVALKIMYFGKRFYGFASEAQIEPTIEIISLFLRSHGKGIGGEEEINYVMVLNRVLPKDIRVIGSSSVPLDFSARFSCLSRKYVYLFWRESMDISVMQKAAKKFIGEHDFRNFCKMDAVNVSNYRRHITEITISPCSRSSTDDNLWAVTIKGSAFLWHQVRCMVSVLFMVGEGLESPHIIDVLLDINKTPRKPQYIMASEIPLVLHCCEFQGVNFICSSDARRNLQEHLTNELRGYLLQAAIVEEALDCLQTPGVEESSMEQHKKKGHISLMLRPTEPSYEERRAKWAMKSAYKRSDLLSSLDISHEDS